MTYRSKTKYPPILMSNQWFYSDNSGSQAGPVSENTLHEKITSGEVAQSALVWQEGMPDWVPATSIEALQIKAVPQPQITSAPNEKSSNPYASPQAELDYGSSTETKRDVKSILFSFQGRIPRRTYWGYSLGVSFIFLCVIGGMIAPFILQEKEPPSAIWFAIVILYIPMVWINLALQAKRWHDRDKSGWWICINFIPYIRGIWSFIENGCLRGTHGPNQYGQDPT